MNFKKTISYFLALCMVFSLFVAYNTSEVEGASAENLHPTGHMMGRSFTMRGNIDLSFDMRWTKVQLVRRYNNKVVQQGGYNPKSKRISLYKMGQKVDYSKLNRGWYTIKIWAKSKKNGKWYLIRKRDFAVSNITAKDNEHPYNVSEGTQYFPSGKIRTYFKFKQIRITVRDRNGKIMQSASMITEGRDRYTFDMKNFERAGITLSKLPAGTYSYYVDARDVAGGKFVVRNHNLDVIGKNDFTLKQGTVPENLNYGQPFSLKGYVEGKRRVRKVRAVVRWPSGTPVKGFNIYENKTLGSYRKASSYTHNLGNIDTKVKFNDLSPGTYTYELHAAGKNGDESRVRRKQFTVSRIKIYDINTQSTSKTKKITGTVDSTFPIRRLSIWCENENGNRIANTYQTVTPNKSKMYLGNTFDAIPVSRLNSAKYRFVINVTDKNDISRKYKTSYYSTGSQTSTITYKYRKLSYSSTRFKKIGKQPVSGPCGCYCIAYGRLVIDGRYDLVPKYKSYYNQITRHFGRGSHLAYWSDGNAAPQWTSTISSAYRLAAQEIRSGKPCILQVDTGWGSNHFILAIGYRSYRQDKGISLKDFIVLDPADGQEHNLWSDNPYNYSNSTRDKRIIKFNK